MTPELQSEKSMGQYKPLFNRRLLAAAITSISLSMMGCGGNDDYAAQSCEGNAGSNSSADDCRHFNGESPTPKPNPQPNPDPIPKPDPNPKPDPDPKPTPGIKAWEDYEYQADSVSALTANAAISFAKHDDDEEFDDIDIVGDTAIVASHYHNRIRSFLLTDGVATLQQGLDFAAVSGGRYQVDAVSGATEQLLTDIDVEASDSGLIVVGEVVPYDGSTKTGVGTYVSRSDSAGNFNPIKFASQDSKNYHAVANISAQDLSQDGQRLAVADEAGKVAVLSSDSLTKRQSTTLDFSVHSLAFSADGKWLYVGGKKKIGLFGGEGVVVVLDANSLAELGRLRSETDSDFIHLQSAGDRQVVAQVAASSQALMLQWQVDGKKVSQQRYIAMPASIKRMSVIEAKNRSTAYLAVSDSQNRLNIIDLKTGKRGQWQQNKPITSVALDSQGFAWILSGNSVTSVPFSF